MDLPKIIEAAERCGLGDTFAEYHRYLARAEQLNDTLVSVRAKALAPAERLIQRLAAGENVPPGEVESAALKADTWSRDCTGAMTYVRASGECRRLADLSARPALFGLFGAAQLVAGAAVERSVELAATVGDARSIDDAVRLGSVALGAWHSLGELYARFMACHGLRRELELAGVIEKCTPHSQDRMSSWSYFKQPRKLQTEAYVAAPVELRLAMAEAVGAGPGLYPADEAMSRRRRHVEITLADMNPPDALNQEWSQIDGNGNVIGGHRPSGEHAPLMPLSVPSVRPR